MILRLSQSGAVFLIVLGATVSFTSSLLSATVARAQTRSFPLIGADETVEFPRVLPNRNLIPAGTLEGGMLSVDLEVRLADWRIEGPNGPGLAVATFAVAGEAPQIPAPLLRVREGTRMHVSVRNLLADSTLTVFGLSSRPGGASDSLIVLPGEVAVADFEAGQPGTYFYSARLGAGSLDEEREQLAGAFVVDPWRGSPPDRIFVLNIFSTAVDTAEFAGGWYDALTINGLSWPFTELQRPSVGDTLRWRVINASNRYHPMHLHGFYFDVLSVGTQHEDSTFAQEDRRTVVTESMMGGSTMMMRWTPTRPGNWLFHCHLIYHVVNEIRLPGAVEADSEHAHAHMAGLVLGIEVQPGPTDVVSDGEPEVLDLYVREEVLADGFVRRGYATAGTSGSSLTIPGPTLVFTRGRTVRATVHNELEEPTGVHWHGLELESWADGVPGWSRTGDRFSPAIRPGESFTYELALQRAGTFIYHTHLNDIVQITSGLYGPLIVLEDGERYDPSSDHTFLISWDGPEVGGGPVVNGVRAPQPHQFESGRSHRLRLINIGDAAAARVRLEQNGEPVPWQVLAKDGADVPSNRRVEQDAIVWMGVGETNDFLWTPPTEGSYEAVFVIGNVEIHQLWTVTAPGE